MSDALSHSQSGEQDPDRQTTQPDSATRPVAPLSHAQQVRLFDEVCGAGGADPELVDRLQDVLRTTPGAIERYLNYTAMHADLYGAVRLARVHELVTAEVRPSDASDLALNSPASTPVVKRSLTQIAMWATPLIATAATLLFFLPQLWDAETPEPGASQMARGATTQEDAFSNAQPTEDPLSVGPEVWIAAVAKINRSSVVGGSHREGDMILAGDTVQFDSGMMEIEFQQGAVVALEGPASFKVSSRNSGLLALGRLAAVVPPWADGFCINTEKLQVVDRGTSFAVSVDQQQDVSVTVTKGEVEVFSPKSQLGRRVLAGGTVQADTAAGIQSVKVDASLVSLTKRLPERPDGSDVEVVGRYQHDWISGTPDEPRRAGPWRYYTNASGVIGRPEQYRELLWDPRGTGCYDVDGATHSTKDGALAILKLRQGSGHPGWGTQQSPDGTAQYAIAAFTVPEDGAYRVESGWIFRPENLPSDKSMPWRERQSVDVVVHVDSDDPIITAECKRDGFLQFNGPLGKLRAGTTVYVGVGPGDNNFNDRFEWGFFIVRELELVVDLRL